MNNRNNSLAAMAILMSVFVLAACGSKEGGSPPSGAAAAPPPEVDVVTVAKGAVDLTQDLPGRLSAYRSAQVRARVEGIIEKRLFIEGSDVKEGDMLFQIDARNYQAAFDSASADVSIARQNVDRYTRLFEKKMVSQQDFDLSKSKLKLAEATLSRAKLDLENTHVPAPISGRIGRAQVT